MRASLLNCLFQQADSLVDVIPCLGWTPGLALWQGHVPLDLSSYHADFVLDKKRSAGFVRRLVTTLFSRFLRLWKLRNDNRHGSTAEEKRNVLLGKLRARAMALSNSGLSVPAHLQLPSSSRVRSMTVSQLQAYIRWADVLQALAERPPAAPDPDPWAGYDFFSPRHSRTPANAELNAYD